MGEESRSWPSRAYIDLNPVAAGIAEVPEPASHTAIKVHSEHVQAQGRTEDSKRPLRAVWRARGASAGLEESHWLCPIEDRRRLDSCREGMLGTERVILVLPHF